MSEHDAAPPIVCDMTSAPDNGDERVAEYARLFDAAFVSRERTDDRVTWRLRADTGIEAWARDLAAREEACCAFMTHTVTVVGEHVVWEATTIDDPTARAVLDLYYDLPQLGNAAPETMWEQFESTGVPIVVNEGSDTRPVTRAEARQGLPQRGYSTTS